MATRFSNALIRDSATTARFSAWAQFIEDTLVTTGGWVVTADTGQTLPSVLAGCTAPNQKQGYRIYRMNDSLQATFPVFIRIDFGSGGATSTNGFWVTIGKGSDGAGNITDMLWPGGRASSPNIYNASSGVSPTTNSYGSATPGRASIATFIGPTAGYPIVFCIERTKNVSGADTGDGLLLVYTGGVSSGSMLEASRYIIYGGGSQPNAESGLSYILTGFNPSQSFGGDIGVGVISHFKGSAQQPGINFLVVNAGDFGVEAGFSVTLYGSAHTYQQLNVLPPGVSLTGVPSSPTNDSVRRCAIRYE